MDHYGTAEGFAAYVADMQVTLPCGSAPASVTAALVRASRFIDGRYGARFVGTRAGGYAQALAWPRSSATTREGSAIPSDAVPIAVEYATYEAALRDLAAPGSLSPDFIASQQVKREKVDVIEVEYTDTSKLGSDALRPVLTVIDDLLFDLLYVPLPAVLVV